MFKKLDKYIFLHDTYNGASDLIINGPYIQTLGIMNVCVCVCVRERGREREKERERARERELYTMSVKSF